MAMFRVTFADGHSVIVNSADATSYRAAALRKAKQKAAAKARKKLATRVAVTAVNCVG